MYPYTNRDRDYESHQRQQIGMFRVVVRHKQESLECSKPRETLIDKVVLEFPFVIIIPGHNRSYLFRSKKSSSFFCCSGFGFGRRLYFLALSISVSASSM